MAFDDINLTVEYIILCRHSDISWSRKLNFGSPIFIYVKEICRYMGHLSPFKFHQTIWAYENLCLFCSLLFLFPFSKKGIIITLEHTGKMPGDIMRRDVKLLYAASYRVTLGNRFIYLYLSFHIFLNRLCSIIYKSFSS